MFRKRAARTPCTLPRYSPPPPPPPPPPETPVISDLIISTITESIKSSYTKPVKKILHLIKPYHLNQVINTNNNNTTTLQLHPLSVLRFFEWISSQTGFTLPLHSYATLARFLCAHNFSFEAVSVLYSLVLKLGNNSAFTVFKSLIQSNNGGLESDSVYGLVIDVYLANGFVSDCVQCFRLIRKHGIDLPVNSCARLFRHLLRNDGVFNFFKLN